MPLNRLATTQGRPRTTSLGRHRRNCTVCAHPTCADIEADFVSWRSPEVIAQEYGLADRASVYRHAHALGLFPKRQRNVRAALERIIEKAGEVEVSAAAVVAAVQAYSKINAKGQWVDRSEHVYLNDLFERMTLQEMEAYARDGSLPTWFSDAVNTPATGNQPKTRYPAGSVWGDFVDHPVPLAGPPAVTPYKFPSVPWTSPASGLPPAPNRYRVVKVWAGNDPDALSQSAATIIEVLDFLVVASNAANASVRIGANPYTLLQFMATS